MKEAVIVAATRTPVGKAIKGTLAQTRPDDMAATVVRGLLERAGNLDPKLVEDLILGCAFPEGEQGMNFARQVVFLAGLPDETSAMSINRFCSSGLESIHLAALKVMSGTAKCVVAGGAESMSMVPMGGNKFAPNPTLASERPLAYLNMGLTAERLADKYDVSREDQDAFACESHRRAVAAQNEGRFVDEISPVTVERVTASGNGAKPKMESTVFDRDEGPRADTNLETLAKLGPAFKMGGTVTAGQIGASAVADKESVAGEEVALGMQADPAGGMAGGMDYIKGYLTQLQGFFICQPDIRIKIPVAVELMDDDLGSGPGF